MDDKDTSRLEAFSDGVFAVAITLLVLDIKVPEMRGLDDQRLWMELLKLWPSLIAYITSFATIGIMWLNHHRLFKHIQRTNTGLLLMNLLLLMVVAFIPVPTALLARYLDYPDRHTAAVVYCGTFVLMALCFNRLWHYASYRGRLLDKDVDMKSVKAISQQYLFGPLLYLIAFVLAWISMPISIIFSFLLALVFALPGRPLRLTGQKQ